jgi:5,6-dimethylbenzimidazole synthase
MIFPDPPNPESTGDSTTAPEVVGRFSDAEISAVYKAIALRRDIRHFRTVTSRQNNSRACSKPAAHQAPSVGFMQPWRFHPHYRR